MSCAAAAVGWADLALAAVLAVAPFDAEVAGSARRLAGAFARADPSASLRATLIARHAKTCAATEAVFV